jgi:hypothetical protein
MAGITRQEHVIGRRIGYCCIETAFEQADIRNLDFLAFSLEAATRNRENGGCATSDDLPEDPLALNNRQLPDLPPVEQRQAGYPQVRRSFFSPSAKKIAPAVLGEMQDPSVAV